MHSGTAPTGLLYAKGSMAKSDIKAFDRFIQLDFSLYVAKL